MTGAEHAEVEHAGVEIARVASLIAAARRLMAEGQTVDLSALEQRVSDLCKVVRAVPDDRREAWRSALSDLLGDLDRLEGELQANHKGSAAEVTVAARRRVMAAYETDDPDSPDGNT